MPLLSFIVPPTPAEPSGLENLEEPLLARRERRRILLFGHLKNNRKKQLDVATHFILACAGVDLFSSGNSYGLRQGIGKMFTGAANSLRNTAQMVFFAFSDPENRNRNQKWSNLISCLTNLPQALGGALTARLPDAIAAGMTSAMYGIRTGNYHLQHRQEKNPSAGKIKTLTDYFGQQCGFTIARSINFIGRHRKKIPGTIMIVRGAIQSLEDPVAGGCFATAGVMMLTADFNGSNKAPNPTSVKTPARTQPASNQNHEKPEAHV